MKKSKEPTLGDFMEDIGKIVETTDETDLKEQAACAGGACEIV